MGRKSQSNYNTPNGKKSLRSGTLSFIEACIGLSHKEVGTYSLGSGFDIEIFLSRVYLEKPQSLGDGTAMTYSGTSRFKSATSSKASLTSWYTPNNYTQYQNQKSYTTLRGNPEYNITG